MRSILSSTASMELLTACRDSTYFDGSRFVSVVFLTDVEFLAVSRATTPARSGARSSEYFPSDGVLEAVVVVSTFGPHATSNSTDTKKTTRRITKETLNHCKRQK